MWEASPTPTIGLREASHRQARLWVPAPPPIIDRSFRRSRPRAGPFSEWNRMDESFVRRRWVRTFWVFLLANSLVVLPGLAMAQEVMMAAGPDGQPVQL